MLLLWNVITQIVRLGEVIDMTPVLVEFLVGLYFVVADSPVLFAKPLAPASVVRFVLGVVLVVLAFMNVSLIH